MYRVPSLRTQSDLRKKEIALGRIKRLANAGLPIESLVRCLFDLINDAIPNSPNKVFHVGDEDRISAYIGSSSEIEALVPAQKHYFVDSRPEVGGIKFPYDAFAFRRILPSRTIWTQNDLALPNLYNAEGYNNVYRPLGWHKVLQVVFHEAGEYFGYCPVWRTSDQGPFGSDDVKFFSLCAPHIAHGLRAARIFECRGDESSDGFHRLPKWQTGIILLDLSAKPFAIDANAKLIFAQIGALDGLAPDPLSSGSVRTALEYVTRLLSETFRGREGDSLSAMAPVYRIYHHRSGITLKLRAVLTSAVDGREYVTVLVERGETRQARRRRLMARFGLSPREAEVLSLVAQGKSGPEISILLNISHDTARKHMAQVLEKLGVENRTAAAAVALEELRNPVPEEGQ